jgi:hypothetical protein
LLTKASWPTSADYPPRQPKGKLPPETGLRFGWHLPPDVAFCLHPNPTSGAWLQAVRLGLAPACSDANPRGSRTPSLALSIVHRARGLNPGQLVKTHPKAQDRDVSVPSRSQLEDGGHSGLAGALPPATSGCRQSCGATSFRFDLRVVLRAPRLDRLLHLALGRRAQCRYIRRKKVTTSAVD